jgi:hypothetical protein
MNAPTSQGRPLPPTGVQTPSVLTSGVMIFAVKTALGICGYAWVIRWIRRQVESVPTQASVDSEAVRTSERVVAMAGALYPGRALCLEQSLVLYYLLRRQGVAVKHCHGVIPRPFQAHAWIEYRGEVINDVPEHARQFVRLPAQLP